MIDEILEKIVQWGETEDAIRALILVGSRATEGEFDELSDYDISAFCTSNVDFIQGDQWQRSIGKVWVCLPLNMRSWVDSSTWDALQSCFAHFEINESWDSLSKTILLFKKLGRETAELLKYKYPSDVEDQLNIFC